MLSRTIPDLSYNDSANNQRRADISYAIARFSLVLAAGWVLLGLSLEALWFTIAATFALVVIVLGIFFHKINKHTLGRITWVLAAELAIFAGSHIVHPIGNVSFMLAPLAGLPFIIFSWKNERLPMLVLFGLPIAMWFVSWATNYSLLGQHELGPAFASKYISLASAVTTFSLFAFILGYFAFITAKHERLLKESEAHLSNAQRIAHFGNWDWNLKTRAQYWSDEVYRIFGHEPQSFEAAYETFLEIIHPDDRQTVKTTVEKALRNEIPYVAEYRVVLPDGSVRHVHELGEVAFDQAGEPLHMTGAIYDITESKKLQLSLEDASKLNETIFSGSPIGIATYDHTGQCRSANDAFTHVIGATREQVLSQNFHQIPSWKKGGLYDKVLECLFVNERKKHELHVVSSFGKDIYLDCDLVPINVNEERNLLLMINDVTENRNIQKHLIQTSKLASLGEMATNAAHEINQPLNIIRMSSDTASEMLEDRVPPTPEVLKKLMGRISIQTNRAATIIDRMRVFGRKPTGNLAEVIPSEAVLNAIGFMSEQLRLDGIELEVDVPDACRPVMGDIIQLEQVVLNLLTNSRDAIGGEMEIDGENNSPNRIVVRVEDDPATNVIKLVVKDTGGGIPQDVLLNIFDPFYTTKEVGKGTGVGLSISYGIVIEMGGTITAENSDGGAMFTVTLPAANEEPDQT